MPAQRMPAIPASISTPPGFITLVRKVSRFINQVLIACTLFSAVQANAQILLEDFSSLRKNGAGTDLWSAYLGEDPGQTYALDTGTLKVVGDTTNCATNNGSGCGIYMQFYPINSDAARYVFPNSFAQYWIKSGTWDPNVNRLRFAVKCNANVARRSDGWSLIQVGTYVKNHNDSNSSNQGDHYYHFFDPNIYANRWIIYEMNRLPQHKVSDPGSLSYPENPSAPSVNYFDGLTRFYFDTQWNVGDDFKGVACSFDNFQFYNVQGEPETLVSGTTATYSGTAYEVSWNGPKNQAVSYEVRYSNSSMKTNGFSSGTSGGTVSTPNNDYTGVFWKSPAMSEAPMIYVAIRPTSGTAFSEIAIPNMSSTQSTTPTCDLNGDGVVTSQDVTLAKNMALGLTACTGDLDSNGRCDIVDVQRVINASNGGSCRVGP